MLNELLQMQSLASAGNVVRVRIPTNVAHDLQSMHKVTAEVLRHLGCEACHSGFDIRYDVAREFVVDENLGVKSAG
jgi:hypothetical protein